MSTYQKYIVSEINDKEKLPKGNFPINLNSIQIYQRLKSSIIAKYKMVGTIKFFRGGSNTDLKLIMCKDNILFCKNSKVMYYIGTIIISFMQ